MLLAVAIATANPPGEDPEGVASGRGWGARLQPSNSRQI